METDTPAPVLLSLVELEKYKESNVTSQPFHFNFDHATIGWTLGNDPNQTAVISARCRRCWSRLNATSDDGRVLARLACQGCGVTLDGNDAVREYQRMFQEQAETTMRLCGMLAASFVPVEEGPFLWVTFPPLERETRESFEQQVKRIAQIRTPPGKIGRGQFPLGAPGLLFIQARLLTDGLTTVPGFDEGSIGVFPRSHLNPDGTLTLIYPEEQIERGPKYREERMMAMMGANMIAAMSSAFACELVMKAICLTAKNQALKSHDLAELYADLPATSVERIEVYHPEIRTSLERGRGRFGDWRYFEKNAGETAITSLTPTELSMSLLKAARVLLDEAELLGLSGGVKLHANQSITIDDCSQSADCRYNLSVHGGEAPPLRHS